MSENASVGDTTANVGDKAETKTETPVDVVPKAELAKTLDELHKYKKQVKELQLKSEQENAARLKEKEDWKALAELREKEANELKAARERDLFNIERDRKLNAALATLKKEGLIDEAEKLLDKDSLDDLVIEHTDQGRYIVHGKDALVQRWKKELPFAFRNEKPPKINSGGGKTTDVGAGDVTAESVNNAEMQWKSGKITKDDYLNVVKLFSQKRKNK